MRSHLEHRAAALPDRAAFLADHDDDAVYQRLRAGERRGRPQGEDALPDRLEAALGRRLPEARPEARLQAPPSGRAGAEIRYVSP